MALDTSIYGMLNTQFPQFDPSNAMNQANMLQKLKAQQMEMQAAQAASQKANAIQDVLAQSSYEPGQKVDANTLAKIRGLDFNAYSALVKGNLEQDKLTAETTKLQAETDAKESERMMKFEEAQHDAAGRAMEAYTSTKGSVGEKQAAAQKVWDQDFADLSEIAPKGHKMPRQFDPGTFSVASKDYLDRQEKRREQTFKEGIETKRVGIEGARLQFERQKEAESGWTVMNDPTTGATIRYNARTGKASTLDGTPIKAPESVEKQTGRAPTYAQMAAGAFRREFKAKNGREPTSAEILADQASGKGMARTATLKSQMDYYSNETKGLIPQYVDRVSALNLPQVKMFRDALLAGKTQVSDPAVSKALLAANAVAGAYARSLAPTGAGDAETRKHARDLLGITSPADARAKGEQLLSEISAIKASAKESAAEEMPPDGTAPAAPAGVTEYVWNPATKKTEKVQR